MKETPNAERTEQFSPEKTAVLLNLANGNKIGKACSLAGIGRTTFYDWINEENGGAYDPLFAAEYERTVEGAIQVIEDSLFKTAKTGNVTAQIFWLCNRKPSAWKNIQRVDFYDRSGELASESEVIARINALLEDAGTEDTVTADRATA